MTIRYITGPATGTQSGSSWANGAPIANIGVLFSLCVPGDEIHIDAAGTYVSNGGSDGRRLTSTLLGAATESTRVVIRGINQNGSAGKATITGNIRPNPFTTGGADGQDWLVFYNGARFVHVKDLIFTAHGRAMVFGSTVGDNTGMLIEGVECYNVRNYLSQYATCPIYTNTTVRHGRCVGFTRDCFGISGDSNGLRFSFIYADAEHQDDGVGGTGSNGFNMAGTAHDISFDNCTMGHGGRNEGAGYWNGDGYTSANTTYDLRFTNCIAEDWYDGGWDMKSYQTTLTDCIARGNKRNFRFHSASDYVCRRLLSLAPVQPGGTGAQTHVQIEHSAAQPFPFTEVHIYDSLLTHDDPETFITSHEGDGNTKIVFHNSLIIQDAASPFDDVARSLLDCTTQAFV